MQYSKALRLALIAAIGGGLFSLLLLIFIAQMNSDTIAIESLQNLILENPLLWGLILLPVIASTIAVFSNRNFQIIAKNGQYFESLFQVTPLAIVTLDLNHKIINANPSFEKLFGYKEKEIIGLYLDNLITSDATFSEAEKFTSDIIAGKYVTFITQRFRKDGSPVIVELFGVPVIVDGLQIGALGLYHDVTERTLAKQKLKKSEEKYREIFENMIDFLYSHDLKGNFIDVNSTFIVTSGYDYETLLEMNIADLMFPEHRRFVHYYLSKVIKNGQSKGILPVQSKSGQTLFIEFKNSLIMEDGVPVAIQGSSRDITERFELEEKLKKSMQELDSLARTDALTGLLNRRGIYEHLESELKRSSREKIALSLALVDLDKLKNINDNYGHIVGDEALMSVANAINQSIRSYDRVGRLGGDEFLLVLPGASLDEAENVCARISSTVAKTKTSQSSLSFSVSIGLSSSLGDPQKIENVDDILTHTDDALYTAKQAGGGQVTSYNSK